MGLMGTLTKVAMGYAAARGVDKLAGGDGLQALLGGGAQIKSNNPTAAAQAKMGRAMTGDMGASANNPLAEMMQKMQEGGLGAMMGGADNPFADVMKKMQEGGLDLSSMLGGMTGQAGTGEKGGLLSSMPSGGTGLAGLLTAFGGIAAMQGEGARNMLDQFNTRDLAPEAEAAAGLMLRAMIQAAKADGGIDKAEEAKLMETLGDADADDMAFVKAQLAAPVDAAALAADTPAAQRMQVYSASLMTIRVDTQAEAEYLDTLAKALELDEVAVNALHMQMGIQPLYA